MQRPSMEIDQFDDDSDLRLDLPSSNKSLIKISPQVPLLHRHKRSHSWSPVYETPISSIIGISYQEQNGMNEITGNFPQQSKISFDGPSEGITNLPFNCNKIKIRNMSQKCQIIPESTNFQDSSALMFSKTHQPVEIFSPVSVTNLVIDSQTVDRSSPVLFINSDIKTSTESILVKLGLEEIQPKSLSRSPWTHVNDQISANFDIELKGDDQSELCPICIEETIKDNRLVLVPCSHICCIPCFVVYLYQCLFVSMNKNINCVCCDRGISQDFIDDFLFRKTLNLEPSLVEKIDKIRKSIHKILINRILSAFPQFSWCPGADCNFGFFVNIKNCKQSVSFKCPNPRCQHTFCLFCRNEPHPNKRCEDSIKNQILKSVDNFVHSDSDVTDDKSVNQEDLMDVKFCPHCQNPYMKIRDGSCNLMTCYYCSNNFCWLCQKKVGYSHFVGGLECSLYGNKKRKMSSRILTNSILAILSPAVLLIFIVALIPAFLVYLPTKITSDAHRRWKQNKKTSKQSLWLRTACIAAGSVTISPILYSAVTMLSVVSVVFLVYLMMPYQIINQRYKMNIFKKGILPQKVEVMELKFDITSWFDLNDSSECPSKDKNI